MSPAGCADRTRENASCQVTLALAVVRRVESKNRRAMIAEGPSLFGRFGEPVGWWDGFSELNYGNTGLLKHCFGPVDR